MQVMASFLVCRVGPFVSFLSVLSYYDFLTSGGSNSFDKLKHSASERREE